MISRASQVWGGIRNLKLLLTSYMHAPKTTHLSELYVRAIKILRRDEAFFDEAEEMAGFSEDTDTSDDDEELIKKMTKTHPAMQMLRKLGFGSSEEPSEVN